MDQPGVTTKPIKLISGKSPFCETFFDDAKAPQKDLVGGLNKGWTVAKRLLEHERTMISAMGLTGGGDGSEKTKSGLAEIGKKYAGTDANQKISDKAFRKKVTLHDLNSRAFGLTMQRVGEVSAIGDDVEGINIGERYVAYPWMGCGDCDLCNDDMTHYCANNSNLGIHVAGGYGDHVLVPDQKYLFSAADTPDSLAGSYACRGLTAYSALKKAGPYKQDNSLVIVSAGGLGVLALKIAQAAYGINPIVVDIDDEKLGMARQLGASATINSSEEGAAEKLMELTEGGARSIVDFVGSEA